ncbi:MAG: 16S rRNA (cytosine(1402)-N(4))-methyltransferase, partial [Gallionella sp.]
MNEATGHTTVLLNEAVEALAIKPDGIYVDGTFGRGGHSKLILERLGGNGVLIALDKDPAAISVGKQWRDHRFRIVHSSFAKLEKVLSKQGVDMVDGILLELG